MSVAFLLTTRSDTLRGASGAATASRSGFEPTPTNSLALRYLQAALQGGVLYPSNPWRASLSRGRLDWHDLVTIASPPKSMAVPLSTLQRHMRDDAKDALISLLQDTGPRAHTASSRPALGWAQERLISQLRVRVNSNTSLINLLSRSDAVAAAAVASGIDVDDVSEHRWSADAGAPLAGCTIVRDKCLLHSSLRACVREAFCGWCVARSTCLTRNAAYVQCEAQPGVIVSSSSSESLSSILLRGEKLTHARSVLVVDADSLPPARHTLRGADGAASPNCSFIVGGNLMTVDISGNSKMAYHWVTETLPLWMSAARAAPSGGLRNMNNVVLIKGEWNDLLSWATIFSPHSCLRSERSAEVKAACFAVRKRKTPQFPPGPLRLAIVDANSGQLILELVDQDDVEALVEPLDKALQRGLPLTCEESLLALESIGRGGPDAITWLAPLIDTTSIPPAAELRKAAVDVANRIKALTPEDFGRVAARECGAWWEDPNDPASRPVVVIISRLNKRLLLNEPDLVRVALSLGAEVHVAALERMSVCAQVLLFQRASVVVGVHGSALINSILMRKSSVMLQIVPFSVRGAGTYFEGPAIAHGVHYLELAIEERSATIPHEHFLKPSVTAEKLYQDVSAGREINKDVWFSFMINQDSIVSVERFAEVLKDALALVGANVVN